MRPHVGDRVMYVPECQGDQCAHAAVFDRAAMITKVHSDEVVDLVVFHPHAVAFLDEVPMAPETGTLRHWYWREDGIR